MLDLKFMAALKGDLSPSYGTKPCYRAGSTLAQQQSGSRTVNCLLTDLCNTAPELIAD